MTRSPQLATGSIAMQEQKNRRDGGVVGSRPNRMPKTASSLNNSHLSTTATLQSGTVHRWQHLQRRHCESNVVASLILGARAADPRARHGTCWAPPWPSRPPIAPKCDGASAALLVLPMGGVSHDTTLTIAGDQ